MIPFKLDDLSYSRIEEFLAAGARESRTLEFKREPVGKRDQDKREFLADVSALANTAGGDLIFGIAEDKGEFVSLVGLQMDDPDAEISRIENILRTGLEPRVSRIEVRWFPAKTNVGCILVRVPRSFSAPHRVTYQDHGKFYGRNSAGKYPFDVTELRSAFLSAESIVQSLRRFRQERLSVIEAGEGAVPLPNFATLVFHVVPLSSLSAPIEIEIDFNRDILFPMTSGSGFNTRHTIEGFATYVGQEDVPGTLSSYSLLFRSGIVEAVSVVGFPTEQGLFLPPSNIESALLKYAPSYIKALLDKGLEQPYYLFVSLLGIRGYILVTNRPSFGMRPVRPRQDVLLFPEIVLNDPDFSADKVFRKTFDRFWNAFGYPQSASFDASGTYVGS